MIRTASALRLTSHVILIALLGACAPSELDPPIPNAEEASERSAFNSGSSPAPHLAKVVAILNQIKAQKGFGTFAGKDQVSIAYAVLRAPVEKGAIVVLPGRTEPYLKYFELVHDLKGLGYSIYLMDHRGQGLSGRMLADTEKGYVESFDDYVDDLKTFLETIVTPRSPGRPIVIAHSMGGGITTSFLESHRDDLRAAVLVSPMHQLQTGQYPELVAQSLATGACLVGKGEDYAIGQGPYDPAWSFADNDVTHDESRFNMGRQLIAQNPGIALGGVTFRWLKESLEASWAMRMWAFRIKAPLLLLQAGQDTVVKTGGQDSVCKAAASCKKIAFPGAYHELLQEQDSVRTPALDAIRAFIKQLPPS